MPEIANQPDCLKDHWGYIQDFSHIPHAMFCKCFLLFIVTSVRNLIFTLQISYKMFLSAPFFKLSEKSVLWDETIENQRTLSSLLQKYGRALITRLTFQTPVILTGLNNVCACLRSQGSYWCERSGHHNKAWKNRSILYSARFVLKSIIKLKTIKRNLIYSSSLNHWPTLLVHWSLKVEQ